MKKQAATIFFLFIVFINFRCTELSPSDWSTITVYVYWQDTGVPDKKIEIIQTGETRYTDERGIAEFTLSPGSYTVRVYDINRGGPCCGFVEYDVMLKTSTTEKIDVFDCQSCA
ncbi:MAG: hypothetical protein L0287_34780 [Anaerolineae bacterium]|nr:hypothetical protein [Anaerolineae bacterium]MCI0708132.1 hypothetical protein [Ignavibacteriota bacterium]